MKSYIQEVGKVITGISTPELAAKFLRDILTPQELETIALRWQIVKLLHRGFSQRKVAKKLGVSLCKVTRGSRELRYGHKGFISLLRKYG